MKHTVYTLGFLWSVAVMLLVPLAAHAATTAPQQLTYNGRLLDASGNAITSSHSIRFSFWNTADFTAAVLDGNGSIDTGHATYAGWNEVQTVTPNAQGYFSVTLGSVTALPDFSSFSAAALLSLYLQVEVKQSAAPNTSYELLDIDSSSDSLDRSQVNSVPFALNANFLDKRQVGTGSGDIVTLISGGLLSEDIIPIGTAKSSFVLDTDDTESSEIALQFGSALGKKISWDFLNAFFNFNASANIQGDLTVTGTVNGIDLASLSTENASHLKVTSGAALTINMAAGSYNLRGSLVNFAGQGNIAVTNNTTNYVFFGSGGLTVNTSGFPINESFIQLAEVVTSGGIVTSITDRRALSTDMREQSEELSFHPQFANASYSADGSNNIGQLKVDFDNSINKNHYIWSSTPTTLQDYDIVVPITLPSDFVRWNDSAALTAKYRTSTADITDNKLDIMVLDTAGSTVTLSGGSSNLAGTGWNTTTITFGAGSTWTAGQDIVLKYKLSSKNSNQTHLGSMVLKYTKFIAN